MTKRKIERISNLTALSGHKQVANHTMGIHFNQINNLPKIASLLTATNFRKRDTGVLNNTFA